MRNLCLGLLVAVLATLGSVAHAEDRTHDGFMMRFTGGAGYGTASEEVGARGAPFFSKWSLSGGGVMFSADVGGSFVDNLVLHARFGAMVVSQPTLDFQGGEVEVDGMLRDDDSSLSFILLAPAITYYFMPANLYVTGAFGLGLIGIRLDEDTGGRTDPGWALNLDLGWEFWVGRTWAMGPAVRFFYTSVPDEYDLTVNGGGFGVLFSATFQ